MQYALQNLMDSHDTDRLASMIVNAGPAAVCAAGSIRLRHRRVAAVRAGVRRPQAERPRAARAAAGGAAADDVRRAADDLLRHRSRHVGRRRPVRPHADGVAGAEVRTAAGAIRWVGRGGRTRWRSTKRCSTSIERRSRCGETARRCGAARSSSSPPTIRPSFSAFAAADGDETLLVGLNRGDDAVSLEDSARRRARRVEQVFTASGDVDQFTDRSQTAAKRSSPCRPSMASCCELSPKE